MARILLFNPSHEMALAANADHYTPPKQIQKMEEDLSLLPLLWAEEGDVVLTSTKTSTLYSSLSTSLGELKGALVPAPWGWNKSVRNDFLRLGVDASLMPSEQQLDSWRSYASRAWAVDYCHDLYRMWKGDGLVSNHTSFIHTCNDLEAWLSKYGAFPFIVKAEYSSSGRGNRVINPKSFHSSLSTLHSSLIDTFYDKILDFAVEFEVTKHEVRYLGLSAFKTSPEGRYAFNYLRSQQELREMIVSLLPNEKVLNQLIELHHQLLSDRLFGQYEGIVGIDMMVVREGLIHPCVEINLRMNMGVVAMKIYERQNSISQMQFNGYFRPVIEDGKFYISYTLDMQSGQ